MRIFAGTKKGLFRFAEKDLKYINSLYHVFLGRKAELLPEPAVFG